MLSLEKYVCGDRSLNIGLTFLRYLEDLQVQGLKMRGYKKLTRRVSFRQPLQSDCEVLFGPMIKFRNYTFVDHTGGTIYYTPILMYKNLPLGELFKTWGNKPNKQV